MARFILDSAGPLASAISDIRDKLHIYDYEDCNEWLAEQETDLDDPDEVDENVASWANARIAVSHFRCALIEIAGEEYAEKVLDDLRNDFDISEVES